MSAKKTMYVDGRRNGRKQSATLASRRRRHRTRSVVLSLVLVLVMVTAIIALVRFVPTWLPNPSQTDTTTSESTTAPTTGPVATATPTASPTPTPPPANLNPQLLPDLDLIVQSPGTPADGCSPAQRGIVTTIFDQQYNVLGSFNRTDPLSLLNPLHFNKIAGVLTFRGNNFRNAPTFGLVNLADKKLTQSWQFGIGSLPSSSWSFNWTGTGWTGQPLLVQWDDDIRQLMNINAEKKAKAGLIEVIYATLDGKIYFFDIDDGQPTRHPINIGAPIKGTPTVDPRGYPILYVGQGDENTNVDSIGFRIFNLIDQSLLLYRKTADANSFRKSWGACDSSPMIDGAADTLIYPNENGLIYTAKLNTAFNRQTGELSINPVFTIYRYKMTDMENFGIESSMAIYDHLGFFADNSGILNCVDLNSLQPVWSRRLLDDSDVTPVLEQTGETVALYCGTEVDWQKNIIGNYEGEAVIYKIDAMTGEMLWQNSHSCWTKNAANYGDDINGGIMGTPVSGKMGMSDLVIFSFSMTTGIYSGNSVVAYDKETGDMVWEYKMANYSWSSPVDVYDQDGHGYILIPDSQGILHLIDGANGEKLATLQLTKADRETAAGNIESSCAVFGDRLVIGTRGNFIIGVKLG
ncbi:MAG TPA: pyrrolo-quinoline quinone [Clostridiales bacterium]|nr:pyrrolo-quinoline quinone [Clostridiales bacterium]